MSLISNQSSYGAVRFKNLSSKTIIRGGQNRSARKRDQASSGLLAMVWHNNDGSRLISYEKKIFENNGWLLLLHTLYCRYIRTEVVSSLFNFGWILVLQIKQSIYINVSCALSICTWFKKNQVRRTGFLVYFEMDFCRPFSRTWFFKNQVQMKRV